MSASQKPPGPYSSYLRNRSSRVNPEAEKLGGAPNPAIENLQHPAEEYKPLMSHNYASGQESMTQSKLIRNKFNSPGRPLQEQMVSSQTVGPSRPHITESSFRSPNFIGRPIEPQNLFE